MKFAEHLGAHITPEWRKQCKFHNLWFHEFTNQRKFWWIFIYRYTVWRNESQIGNVYSRGSIARISGTRSFNQIFRKIRWSILHILWKRWVIIRSQLFFWSKFWSEILNLWKRRGIIRSQLFFWSEFWSEILKNSGDISLISNRSSITAAFCEKGES